MAYLKAGHYICSCFKEECNKDCPSYKKFTHKKTNADRIRAMTDEELAEFISDKARTFGEEYEGYMSALDWLKQEVSNG